MTLNEFSNSFNIQRLFAARMNELESSFYKRNANRTSAPGLVANEIVPPPRGMGSMPSAFRHLF